MEKIHTHIISKWLVWVLFFVMLNTASAYAVSELLPNTISIAFDLTSSEEDYPLDPIEDPEPEKEGEESEKEKEENKREKEEDKITKYPSKNSLSAYILANSKFNINCCERLLNYCKSIPTPPPKA